MRKDSKSWSANSKLKQTAHPFSYSLHVNLCICQWWSFSLPPANIMSEAETMPVSDFWSQNKLVQGIGILYAVIKKGACYVYYTLTGSRDIINLLHWLI